MNPPLVFGNQNGLVLPIALVFIAMWKNTPVHQAMLCRRVNQFLFRPRPDACARPQDVEFSIILAATVTAVVDLARRVCAITVVGQGLRK